MKTLFFLIFILIFSSCGTIIKNNVDVISIDSSARGYKVMSKDNKYLGTTPFFYEAPKKRTTQFNILKDATLSVPFSYTCSFDTNESILPNALTTFIAWPLGLVGFGLDWYNGNIYRCKEPVLISDLPPVEIKKNQDIELLILPMSVNSFVASNLLIDQFIKNNSVNQNTIHFKRYDLKLAEIGIGPYSNNSLNKLNFELMHPLFMEKKITHLVTFTIIKNDSHYQAIPVVIDVFTKKIISTHYAGAEINYDNVSYLNTIIEKFHIIPNSIKISETRFTDTDPNISTKRHPKAFPKLLTSISIGNVYDPAKYSTWDVDYYTSPNLSMPSWKWIYQSQEYLFQSVVGTLNGGLLFKTPFGAISGEIGFGGIYFYDRPKSISQIFHTCVNVNISYVFYFSKKLFFHATTQLYSPEGVNLGNKKITLQQAYVGLGYFFPTLDNMVQENLLN